MSSLPIDIVKAVATELNAAEAGTFSESFTAEWKSFVKISLQSGDLDSVKVSVIPKSRTSAMVTRADSQHDVSIMIGIQKKVGKDREDGVEGMADFVEEIIDYLTGRALADATDVRFVSIENDPIYDSTQLIEDGVFTSILTIVYMAWRN